MDPPLRQLKIVALEVGPADYCLPTILGGTIRVRQRVKEMSQLWVTVHETH